MAQGGLVKWVQKHRLTNGNCSGGGKRRLRGSENRSRRIAPLCSFPHPHSSPPLCYAKLYKVGWNVSYLERYMTWRLNLLY
jgi:hypothetical protein